jgi:hypothetical protein
MSSRRDFLQTTVGLSLLGAPPSGTLSQSSIDLYLYPQTPAELAANVTPVSHLYPSGNVLRYGADPTDTADSTVAFNSALASGATVAIPAGTFKVTGAITCKTPGQIISGAGRYASIIKAASSFNLSALGVFVVTTGGGGAIFPGIEGPLFRDFMVTFDQSATATSGTRANLIAYPPAFYAQGQNGVTWESMAIYQAMIGIDMRGNSNRNVIDLLIVSAYTTSIWIDGSQDFTRIDRLHFVPLGLTTNQYQNIWDDGNTVGMQCGQSYLNLTDSLFLNAGVQLNFFYGTQAGLEGYTTGYIDGCDLDSYGSFVMSAGQIVVTNSSMSTGLNSGSQWIKLSGGWLLVDNCILANSLAQTTPMIEITGSSPAIQGETQFELNDCLLESPGFDQTYINVSSTGGVECNVIIDGNYFACGPNFSARHPFVNVQSNGVVTFTNNQVDDAGSGSSTLLTIGADGNHVITGNQFRYHGISLPANHYRLYVADNTGIRNAPTLIWNVDGANTSIAVPNGGSVALALGSGLLVAVDQGTGGNTALYTVGGKGVVTCVSVAGRWVASTVAPASGKCSIAWNGAAYAVYNNTGSILNVGFVMLRGNCDP